MLATGRTTSSFRRVTNGAAIFLIVWSLLASSIAVHALAHGQFSVATRRSKTKPRVVAADTHPYTYWGVLIPWSAVAVWCGHVGVSGLLINRREAKEKQMRRKERRRKRRASK